MPTYKQTSFLFFTTLTLLISACENSQPQQTSKADALYLLEVIDAEGPRAPWGKTTGDINGDGLIDLVVGGHKPRHLTYLEKLKNKLGLLKSTPHGGELVWYQNPGWQRHLITEDFKIRTDLEVTDIDKDGKNDIIILTNSGMYWLKNPSWEAYQISEDILHDVESGDLDADGEIEIVVRNQSSFGYQNGNKVDIYKQNPQKEWTHISQKIPHGEGLKLSDMDNDGFLDIIVNQQWLHNPGELPFDKSWDIIDYSVDWSWLDVFIDTADFNQDNRLDIVLSPSEEAGEHYQIAWFEAPAQFSQPWKKHIIDKDVEALHHFVAAKDIDLDGDIDVLSAEMNQSQNTDEVKIYLNSGNSTWEKRIIGTNGSHSMTALDIDNDNDIDLFGANWEIKDYSGNYAVHLWRNTSKKKPTWRRHLIDDDRPGQAIFIYASDLDGDDAKDIITGGYWYHQPDKITGKWQRNELGDPANNIALVADFDKDSDIDILASRWRGYGHKPSLPYRILNRLGIKKYTSSSLANKFVWGQNDGHGNFKIYDNIEPASGDFLQGIDMLNNFSENTGTIVLSWHRTGEGIQSLTIPDNPENQIWQWAILNSESQDEQITTGDIDNDGHTDILLGTKWLQNNGTGEWKIRTISNFKGEPDRNRLVDLNKDGLLDALVGYQAVSKPGKVAWYQQPVNSSDPWQEHLVTEIIGPMSLSIADLDNDADMDIVVGEHNLSNPEKSRLFWYENSNSTATEWKQHLIYQGDEHHDGAFAIDLDDDGDMDIISIGWSHGKVILYENNLQ